jgi:hypothetical protein
VHSENIVFCIFAYRDPLKYPYVTLKISAIVSGVKTVRLISYYSQILRPPLFWLGKILKVQQCKMRIAGHRHRGRCCRHQHSGISASVILVTLLEHSSTGLDPYNPVPDWVLIIRYWFRHRHSGLRELLRLHFTKDDR